MWGFHVHVQRRWFLLAVVACALLLGAAATVIRLQSASRSAEQPVLIATPIQPFDASSLTFDQIAQAWAAAPPLNLALSAGNPGGTALAVQLRAVYSASTIYFWLRWPDDLTDTPSPQAHQQRATLTWRNAAPIGGCAIACHTSFSTGRRIDDLQFVAPDVDATALHLLTGDWQDGWWTLGYSRPLVTNSPLDVQFSDLGHAYQFGVDVAMGPASSHTRGEALLLRFAPR